MDDPWLFVNNSVVLLTLYLTRLLATALVTLELGFSTQKYRLIYTCWAGFRGFTTYFMLYSFSNLFCALHKFLENLIYVLYYVDQGLLNFHQKEISS